MERYERSPEQGLMTAREVAVHILDSCVSLKHFEAYMFGSTLHGVGEDIDLLIVGPAGNLLAQLKNELRTAGESLPLHILYMQPSQEHRTQFVARENCIPLAKLASAAR